MQRLATTTGEKGRLALFSRRQPAGDDRSTLLVGLQADLAAVGFEDLATECQAEAGTGLLGRIEGQQRLLHRFRVHAAAAIDHLEIGALQRVAHPQVDRAPGLSGLHGVVDQVLDHLAHL